MVRSEDHQLAVTRLSQRADSVQILDPAYRAELMAWTALDSQRQDGVQPLADDDQPLPAFDTRGPGWLPAQIHPARRQCLLVLATRHDHPDGWVRAGEALERVLLEVTRHGFAVSALSQLVEVPYVRAALRTELGLTSSPLLLLRVGRAPLTPASRRRRLVDVLIETA